MKRARKEYRANGHKFVVLSFDRETDDPTLNDEDIEAAMAKEELRPVTREEFDNFIQLFGAKPVKPIAAFGNIARGPSHTGSFPGVPYLDTDGQVRIEENWTRGHTGDLWNGAWEFVFTPS